VLRLALLRSELTPCTTEVQALLDGLAEQVSTATGRLRNLLFDLEPDDADAPLARSIRCHMAHLFYGTPVHWSVDDVDAGDELPPAERRQALRIVKEALNNARMHSEAAEVIVTVRGDEEGVEIVTVDDGVTTDPTVFASAPGHRGLATMRDRAAVLGGSCTFETSQPHGCTVRVHAPRVRPWLPALEDVSQG